MKMLINTLLLPTLLLLHLGVRFLFADAFTFSEERISIPSVVHSVADTPITISSIEISEGMINNKKNIIHFDSNEAVMTADEERELLNTYAVLNN